MPTKPRPDPVIPDHVILRKIGGGAYGEVWLARGVTGALRAVKVVWREDFEDVRGFEREFEGILKFEPISRDHPGLVNILHVGRSPDAVSFYYYVMELGDDIRSGREINPIEYEPRTLRPDVRSAVVVRMELGICIEVGLRLAEALHHLHERGLAHRDVKPANVIFVNGRAKLADIGLVATRGQRTFVGTEGFVPPEGPGSTQADVYSLGKVLYEIVTGKDRMDFPELPEDQPLDGDRKRWFEFNRIICDICEPRISKRRITTAAELAEALRLLQRGRRRRSRAGAVWLTTTVLLAFAGWAGWQLVKDTDWLRPLPPPVVDGGEVHPPIGQFRVVTKPAVADVLDAAGNLIGRTDEALPVEVGSELTFTIRKSGFRDVTVTSKIDSSAAKEPQIFFRVLEVFSPPLKAEAWLDHHGNSYQPVGEEHLGFGMVTEDSWRMYLEQAKRSGAGAEFLSASQNGQPASLVLCPEDEARVYCSWLRTGGIKAGFLTEDYEVLPVMERAFDNPGMSERARKDGLRPFRVQIREINFGRIELTTTPPGGRVYLNGNVVGTADEVLTLPRVKPGQVELIIVRDGFLSCTKSVQVKPGERMVISVPLVASKGLVFEKPWVNGLGMRFMPLGRDLMVAVWETRVSDYALFIKESGHPPALAPAFPQGPDHPVVNINRNDAAAFCAWLTARERAKGVDLLTDWQEYRLPTDLEWSAMVGLSENFGLSPNWRDAHKGRVFPWGLDWPPPAKAGNFADASAARGAGVAVDLTIADHDDGFARTAPVGSFLPNSKGLFDLSGNVLEWVSDDFSILNPDLLGVLRGGAWNTFEAEPLYSGSRHSQPPNAKEDIYGFRLVIAKAPTQPTPPAPGTPPVLIPNPSPPPP